MLFIAALCVVGAPSLALLGETPAATSAALPQSSHLDFAAMGAIAALLALGSGLVVTRANALSYDLYYKVVQPAASTERRIFVARGRSSPSPCLPLGRRSPAPEAIHAMTAGAFSFAASALLPGSFSAFGGNAQAARALLPACSPGLPSVSTTCLASRYFPFAFYETSSFLSSATPAEAARYNELRQAFTLATQRRAPQPSALWEDAARGAANWGGIKRDFAASSPCRSAFS